MLLFFSALVISAVLTLIFYGPVMRMLSGANCTKPNFRRHYVVNSFGILLPIVFITSGAIYGIEFVARVGEGFEPDLFFVMLGLVVVTAFAGFIDDLLGSRVIGGLRGHFSQIRFGIMTTGTLKAIIGFSIAAIVSAVISRSALMFLLNLAVLTLSINVTNLFDLRPGRAIKVFTLASLATFIAGFILYTLKPTATFWSLWGFIIPPVIGLLWGDLKERSMLGDAGSNSLGAILGLSFVINLPWLVNVIILGVLIALHVVAEKYSISTFIERTPIIKQLDELGWKR